LGSTALAARFSWERHLPEHNARIVGSDDLSRRSFLIAFAEVLGVAAAGLSWPEIARAVDEAQAASRASSITFLTTSEAADVDAIAAQIIPGGSTPGAREAGVVYFIDRALATFFSLLALEFRAGLAEFQSACRARNPDVTSFAVLSPERQVEFLKTVEQTPFFDQLRSLTVLGMFSMPAYGGNRKGVGWELLGFEDRHVFQPPFGFYDRDYPGFLVDPKKPA
jgi:gluconate 2-dehydrogenase gamma chain